MEESKRRGFEKQLRQGIRGEVSFDQMTLGLYSTDASIYQIKPVAVVIPKDEEDVICAVKAAGEYGVNILPRGGGTSLNGQGVSPAMVIDFHKYMNNILELNVEENWARVQPGIVLDELNDKLAKHGIFFSPDPATSSRATIGGMIGNNASGTKSIVYGITNDHVLELKTLLSDGTVLELKELSEKEYENRASSGNGNTREAEIYSVFKKIIDENRDAIEKSYPKIMRRVQGYNLDSFVNNGSYNMAELMVGSEGTLGITLEAKLNLMQLPKCKALCVVHFNELLEAISTVAPILEHKPSAVEILDSEVVVRGRKNLSVAQLCSFIDGDPAAILIVEFFGETQQEARQKAQGLAEDLENQKMGYSWPIISEAAEQQKVWGVRKNALGLMIGFKGGRKPLPFIEDACVDIKVLPEYIDQILNFCKSLDVPVAMYAHASVGNIHVRPILNLKEQKEIDNMKVIADFTFDLVKKYGGSWSGEHGDGRVRSPYLERFFGAQVYNALREVKKLFDPSGLMNPGVIIDPNPIDQDLRYGTKYKTPSERTTYYYRDNGSFASTVELCMGISACHKTLEGAMCPSYRATFEEEHSTRGRANALRLAMSGQLGAGAMTSKRLFDVLGLCLSCKSCKAECPTNTDIGRLKSEFLQGYHDANGTTLFERMLANAPQRAKKFAGCFAPIVNTFKRNWLWRKMLETAAGADSRRKPPSYASCPFPKWFNQRSKPNGRLTKKVVLFDDTYMNYYQTGVGMSAVELLESCGYEVTLANAGCCQRPKISLGFLREAKIEGEKTLRNLDRYIMQGLKVVVCEPGCCSALTDDLPDLIDDEKLAQRTKDNVMMIDQFLSTEIKNGNLNCEFTSPFKKIFIHGHCHQKSLYGTTAMKKVFDCVPELEVIEPDAGCCGLTTSFGHKKEHYDISMRIGQERLFPAILNLEENTKVVACGFDCRNQIFAGTGVNSIHWTQTVRGKVEND